MIMLNGASLTLDVLKRIAIDHEEIAIEENALILVRKARDYVKDIANQDEAVYGINTGFGHLASVKIDKRELSELQANLLKSHACGVGDPLPVNTVRAMMALRINALIKGYSGLREEVILKLVEYLNHHMIPVVFEKGSLGASGDLALLSHMSLPLIGLGEVFVDGIRMSTQDGLAKLGLTPLSELKAKEGLSLINGTQGMNAIGSLVLDEAYHLYDYANLSLSLTMEALEGITDAYDPRVHTIRNQEGQIAAAKSILSYLEGSEYTTHQNHKRVQDAYSLRCAPQVHGATLDALNHVKMLVEREMNAVTDNPIVFTDEQKAISAGNFHGQPLAMAFDYLGIAIAELASISERRIERMVNPYLSGGLPPFLAKWSGLNSGLMIVQYTAASLVSENKVLAHPASVDSIPSSANQEDHVSMGTTAARKAASILDNTYKVIAMEIFVACQAIDFREKKQMGKMTERLYRIIRREIPFLEKDETLYPYIHKIEAMIKSPEVIKELFKEES